MHRCLPLVGLILCIIAKQVSAEEPAKITASMVDLPKSVKLSKAILLFNKTGNNVVDLRPFRGQEVTDPLLTFAEAQKLPFWQAMDTVAKAANLRVVPFLTKDQQQAAGFLGPDLPGGKVSRYPVVYRGPFRLGLVEMMVSRNWKNPNASQTTALVEIACEPRYEPLFMKSGKQALRASDAQGELVAVEQGGLGQVRFRGRYPVRISLQLPVYPRTMKHIGKILGDFVVYVPAKRISVQHKQLTKARKYMHGAVQVEVSAVQRQAVPARHIMEVRLTYPTKALDLESHEIWAMENLPVFMTNGKDKQNKTREIISIEEGKVVRIQYEFPRLPGDVSDWQFQIEIPDVPVHYPLSFEFTKIPLP